MERDTCTFADFLYFLHPQGLHRSGFLWILVARFTANEHPIRVVDVLRQRWNRTKQRLNVSATYSGVQLRNVRQANTGSNVILDGDSNPKVRPRNGMFVERHVAFDVFG